MVMKTMKSIQKKFTLTIAVFALMTALASGRPFEVGDSVSPTKSSKSLGHKCGQKNCPAEGKVLEMLAAPKVRVQWAVKTGRVCNTQDRSENTLKLTGRRSGKWFYVDGVSKTGYIGKWLHVSKTTMGNSGDESCHGYVYKPKPRKNGAFWKSFRHDDGQDWFVYETLPKGVSADKLFLQSSLEFSATNSYNCNWYKTKGGNFLYVTETLTSPRNPASTPGGEESEEIGVYPKKCRCTGLVYRTTKRRRGKAREETINRKKWFVYNGSFAADTLVPALEQFPGCKPVNPVDSRRRLIERFIRESERCINLP